MDRVEGVSWGWKQELWHKMTELEDWIDEVALRLGDAIFGEATAERVFGPHPYIG